MLLEDHINGSDRETLEPCLHINNKLIQAARAVNV
jgi:hypothetical protein